MLSLHNAYEGTSRITQIYSGAICEIRGDSKDLLHTCLAKAFGLDRFGTEDDFDVRLCDGAKLWNGSKEPAILKATTLFKRKIKLYDYQV